MKFPLLIHVFLNFRIIFSYRDVFPFRLMFVGHHVQGGGNNTTYILCIVDVTGPSRSLLQVLPHFLTSKSLFWCNLPLTILSEYLLDSRLLLCILLYPLPSNCCFFFDFPLFCCCFSFLIITITFSLITLLHLHLAHAFSLVFIDFTLSILFLLFHLFHAFSLISILKIFFLNFFLWFSCSFQLNNAFSLDFLLSVAYTFFFEISGCIYALWLVFSSGM